MEYLVTDLPADRLRMLGRSGSTADGFTCDYSATGVILSLSCEQDQAEVALTFLTDADVYFTVFVDGVRMPERLYVCGNGTASAGTLVRQTVTACTLSVGVHTVRVVRQSNFWHARTTLCAITTDAALLPAPAPRARTFEFIGDSLTCGYGVTEDAPAAPREIAGTARFCDATMAHAFLTAEAFDAECIICGYSGWGLHDHPLAMAYAPLQVWREVYDPETGLSRGTQFAQLDLPFGGDWTRGGNHYGK